MKRLNYLSLLALLLLFVSNSGLSQNVFQELDSSLNVINTTFNRISVSTSKNGSSPLNNSRLKESSKIIIKLRPFFEKKTLTSNDFIEIDTLLKDFKHLVFKFISSKKKEKRKKKKEKRILEDDSRDSIIRKGKLHFYNLSKAKTTLQLLEAFLTKIIATQSVLDEQKKMEDELILLKNEYLSLDDLNFSGEEINEWDKNVKVEYKNYVEKFNLIPSEVIKRDRDWFDNEIKNLNEEGARKLTRMANKQSKEIEKRGEEIESENNLQKGEYLEIDFHCCDDLCESIAISFKFGAKGQIAFPKTFKKGEFELETSKKNLSQIISEIITPIIEANNYPKDSILIYILGKADGYPINTPIKFDSKKYGTPFGTTYENTNLKIEKIMNKLYDIIRNNTVLAFIRAFVAKHFLCDQIGLNGNQVELFTQTSSKRGEAHRSIVATVHFPNLNRDLVLKLSEKAKKKAIERKKKLGISPCPSFF